MFANFQTVLMWIGGFTLFCLMLTPIVLIFTSPQFDDDDQPHGDTTGYDRSGKDYRP
jgi:hypothetical protein